MTEPPAFSIDGPLEGWISRAGRVVRTLRHGDPGCVCFLAVIDERRVFVRQARTEAARQALDRVVHVYERVRHPALPPLWGYWMASDGPFVLFDWVKGERLASPIHVLAGTGRHEPDGPHARFRGLPLHQALNALDVVLDLHQDLAQRGFVSGDFSDSSILYDFQGMRPWVVHLDEFREEPLQTTAEPRCGSPLFLAPEESDPNQCPDERTSVFHLGRTALMLLGDGSGELAGWRGPQGLQPVVARATCADPDDRYLHMRDFVAAWRRETAHLSTPLLALPPPRPPQDTS